ncbi:hypothetical protein [Hoeflea sp.]|uniref:hypothetical protein n=1 Tax=Hoeflea sp. TaxID=1940281 RepID=UPI003B010F59
MGNYRELTEDFLRCAVDPGAFRHRDHIAVAYGLLETRDFVEATALYAKRLKAIATKAGAHGKFNTTITFAFMGLIAERIHRGGHKGFDDFIAENPDLLERHLLDRLYTPERLNCDLARRAFLLPDKIAGSESVQ